MKHTMMRIGKRWMGLTVFTGVFSLIYEHFSHGVYSNWMVFAFLIPLLGVTIPCAVLLLLQPKWMGKLTSLFLAIYQSTAATLLLGSLFAGILEIYGTTNQLLHVYWIAAAVQCVLAAGSLLFRRKRTHNFTTVPSAYSSSSETMTIPA